MLSSLFLSGVTEQRSRGDGDTAWTNRELPGAGPSPVPLSMCRVYGARLDFGYNSGSKLAREQNNPNTPRSTLRFLVILIFWEEEGRKGKHRTVGPDSLDTQI